MAQEIYRTWLWDQLGQKCIDNLKKNGFDAHLVPDVDTARDLILAKVGHLDTFGFGGSDTTRQLGVLEELARQGKTIFDHWQKDLSAEEDRRIRVAQGGADCFFCSANAISASGEIVNVDGIGNRTNAMSFGPQQVVIAAGMNKVAHDLPAALDRIRTIAAPMRAKSLDMKTPCAKTGLCTDCHAPQRICRITTILHRQPLMTEIMVVLINADLGF